MKKVLSAAVFGLVLAGSAVAAEVSVIATIFPVYDWLRVLSSGSDIRLTLLLDNGVDLHSFQPNVEDFSRIAQCDLFVYVGGESDNWVRNALRNSVNNKQISVNILELLGEAAKPELIIEGMEHHHNHNHEHEREHEHEHEHEREHEHEHEHEHEREHEHEHEREREHEREHEHEGAELDEHVWLSLRNAKTICSALAETLSRIDPQHSEIYSANLNSYLQQLDSLDRDYHNAVNSSKRNTLLFADRFPFRYLTDDYGLNYFAAFSGCSAESEASFHTILFLAQKVNELRLPCVLTIEGTDHKIAQTVINTSGSENISVLVMNSLQSTTLRDNTSYLDVMRHNLGVLTEALN